MVDVHIVGGGPTGLFAGISACQKGASVLLSEEHEKIGEPEACSGLISQSGLDSLSGYVDYRKSLLNTIDSACIISGKHKFRISPKKEKALLVSRSKFDSLAAERFEREGGKLELGKKAAQDFKAKCIIGADGPASSVASQFGFPKISRFINAMQGDFAYFSENQHEARIFLSPNEFPGFFGWVIPINESEAKIGVGVSQRHHPLQYYRNFLSRLGVSAHPSREFAAIIPAAVRRKTGIRKSGYSVLLAGDSAGQVKATTGGGVFFGAQCGMLAGRHFDDPEKYEREWRSKFGLDLALHSHFRTLLDMAGGQPPEPFIAMAKALFFEDLLSEEGRMDRWADMLSPNLLLSYGAIVAGKARGKK